MIKGNIIKSITLSNFMCHTNLKLTFNSPITVIGGFNGSGKSAIMIAIGIVLGQRTNALDRGASAKSLIQNGKNCAKIQLELSNAQHQFNYGFFGGSIILEKVIKRDGAHSTRVKNDSGRIFSSKKEDIDFITDYFQLHIDNPLNFLTQENSKKFLKITKAENLYSLFLQGTELDDVAELHEEANRKTTEMKTKLDLLNEELVEVDARRRKKRNDLDIVLDGSKVDERILELKNEIEWSKLKGTLDEIRAKKEDTDALSREVKELDDQINQNSLSIDEMKKEEIEKEREVKRIRTEISERRKMLEEAMRNYELEEREMKNDLEELTRNCNEKAQRLQNLKRLGGVDKLAEKKALLERKLEMEEKYSNKLETLSQKMVEENEKSSTNKAKLVQLRQTELNLSKQIEFLRKIENNKLLFFHTKINEILKEIESCKFNDEVIGPIGSYVTLKDFKWNKAISIILRYTLSNFIVFCKEDKSRLKRIFNKYDANFTILIPSTRNNALIKYEKRVDYKVAIDVIEITHPRKNVILNQLIIMNSLESIILVDDRSVAYSILRKENSKKHRYPITIAYTEDGDKIKMVNNSLSDFRPRVLSFYFEKNLSKLKNLETEHENVREQMDKLGQADKTIDLHKQINELSQSMAENRKHISDLRLETAVNMNDDIEEEIKTAHMAIESLKIQREELEDNLRKIGNSKTRAYREIKESTDVDIPVVDPNVSGKIQRLYIDNNILEKKIHNIQIKMNRKQAEITSSMGLYEMKYNELKKKTEEIGEPRTESFLHAKIAECELKKDICQKLESEETLKSDLNELNEMYEHKKKIITSYESKVSSTLENIKKRIQKREHLKLEVSNKIARKFEELTAKRNYEGILNFDHKEKQLELEMKVNIRAGNKSTLSGGERSFAAMCLILAMWPFISCPVKILDEFDVFMDNLNRDTILQELIEIFKESELQIVLITPLSVKVESVDFIMLEHPNRK